MKSGLLSSPSDQDFDGVKARTVFGFWFDDFRAMSAKRLIALNGIFQTIGTPFCLLNAQSVRLWEVKGAPFHPAISYLSSVHKSDYFRAYFMHHYGGGYSDIKQPRGHWMPFFERLSNEPNSLAIGYAELRPTGVAVNESKPDIDIRAHYQSLIGMCSYIMRKKSSLTSGYLDGVHRVLDTKLELLMRYPAKTAYDNADGWFTNVKTGYPIRWTEIGSEIFHYVLLEHMDTLIKDDLMCPIVTDYR